MKGYTETELPRAACVSRCRQMFSNKTTAARCWKAPLIHLTFHVCPYTQVLVNLDLFYFYLFFSFVVSSLDEIVRLQPLR